ncbi:DUF3810 domain-containing protein [Olivibacter sp. XZL3]|uniref:DUF3810 domain-containing protein n=1 Tax=Olivibacter sp. XZL3 TaxID=1735116 RepID=UPI001066B2A2|nr:DUF3810 domain-containing protein [Olivibacter sp. XZL3]
MKEKIILQLKWNSLLLVLLVVIWWLSTYSGLVERFYSGKFFPVYSIIAQTLTVWIPFSLGDYLYGLLVVVFLAFFVKIARGVFGKNYLLALYYVLKAIKAVLILAICFYSFWGMNYFRLPLETRMGLNMDVSEPCELLETTAICIDRANLFRKKLNEGDLQMTNNEIFRKAEALVSGNSSLQPYIFSYLPTVKSPVTDLLVNYTGIAGYFNPFTQEAQVNTSMPIFSKPFTACHELGHQAGIGFEDEANLVGFILCTESEDALFQYAAYYNAVFMLLKQLAFQDGEAYLHLLKLVDSAVLQDAKEEERYWRQFDGILNDASSRFYNGYLQFNNQPEGLRRYSRMTKLLIAWRRKNASGF